MAKSLALEDAAGAQGRVLLVDDQPELRRLFRRSLHKAGYTVVEAYNGRVAVELAQQLLFDVVISDVHMPDMSGIELLQTLRHLDEDLPVILTSGSPGPDTPLEVGEYGAFAYLVKPVPFDLMHETASRAVEVRRSRAAAKELFEPFASVERLRVPTPSDDEPSSA
jgi:two-component system, chemotaxis family, chemotaxis protein CheY